MGGPWQDDAAFAFGDLVAAGAIAEQWRRSGTFLLAGLCGPQGSGKSTTAARLVERLGGHGLRAIVCALDDFYLTRSERGSLATKVHPLLATRGVPGTHDLALLGDTISALRSATGDTTILLPIFDKALDDRLDRSDWRVHRGPVDIVILEGWCIGARPQSAAQLAEPLNALERDRDADGVWRRYVNEQLETGYAPLFGTLDFNLLLQPPSFDCVLSWRAEQEAGLSRRAGARAPMTRAELAFFIAHYERLTRWLLLDQPADLIVDLDMRRAPYAWRLGAGSGRHA
ncbi:kinase [Sphingomonas sp.]|uniref:kinase n=1 Tax=Sphingomonas sp. TaxID=28214 RepID=UPI0025D88584|nr:kinase [Sphingomonas sp.]